MEKATITKTYTDLVKIFEKTMIEEKMPLWFFDIYLPALFAKRTINKAITIFSEIQKSEDK